MQSVKVQEQVVYKVVNLNNQKPNSTFNYHKLIVFSSPLFPLQTCPNNNNSSVYLVEH